jgi:hypothetical protein
VRPQLSSLLVSFVTLCEKLTPKTCCTDYSSARRVTNGFTGSGQLNPRKPLLLRQLKSNQLLRIETRFSAALCNHARRNFHLPALAAVAILQ